MALLWGVPVVGSQPPGLNGCLPRILVTTFRTMLTIRYGRCEIFCTGQRMCFL